MIKYIPIIKTGESELRALANIDNSVKDFITPLFEITRGRRLPKSSESFIDKKIDFLSSNFYNTLFILDLTSDKTLSNNEIEQLHSSKENYQNWISFCINNKNNFGSFYPVIQIEEEDDYNKYISKLYEQVKALTKEFDFIVFRSQNESEAMDLITDIKELLDKDINNDYCISEKIIYVLDYKYVKDINKCINTAKVFIKALNTLGIKNIVISSTSFPSNVSEYMAEVDNIDFDIKEIELYKILYKDINTSGINLIYSDYASINPIRNDNIYARGWIPRIDVPSNDKKIYCSRKRRDKATNESYAKVYAQIAKQIVTCKYFTNLFIEQIISWGHFEVTNAAEDNVGGATPSFWISTRMSMYLKLMSVKLFDFLK